MKNLSSNFRPNVNTALIVLASLVVIYGFSNSNSSSKATQSEQKNEYMTITVEYQRRYQSIFVSKANGEVERIAFFIPGKRKLLKSRLKDQGFEIRKETIRATPDRQHLSSSNDNSRVLELIRLANLEAYWAATCKFYSVLLQNLFP